MNNLGKVDFFTEIVTQIHESHHGSITLVSYELSFINTTILNARVMATTRYDKHFYLVKDILICYELM